MASSSATDELDDLQSLIAEQQYELMAAVTLDSDHDIAFRLQLEEAIAASLAERPSTSSAPDPPLQASPLGDTPPASFPSFQSNELSKFEQEIRDRRLSESESKKIRDDLHRRIHDQKVAREILIIPDDEWEEWGDCYEKPFGEGSSKCTVMDAEDVIFRVYFKGVVSEERVHGEKKLLSGIGVAICDTRDNLILEVRKPLVGSGMSSRQGAEAMALIEGLNAAIALELKRIIFFCDYYPLYKYVIGKWQPKQRKLAELLNQIVLLKKKFTYCHASLVPRYDVKFAFKLAKDAVAAQITSPSASSSSKCETEKCVICLEDTDLGKIFSVDSCLHRYCFSCMKQHVEVKLLQGILPKCPHEGCKTDLYVSSCSKFLTPKLIETMNQRLKEASIPASEKVYCPYPRCSALMSLKEVTEYAKETLVGNGQSATRKCLKCHALFCINCKVPWHRSISCTEYKRRNPLPSPDVLRLENLAAMNLWRHCIRCNHIIELSEGCYHMTCRCGYEFCYNCGSEWKDKKATCECPLWEEDNIWLEEDRDFDDEVETEEGYDDEEDYFTDEDLL